MQTQTILRMIPRRVLGNPIAHRSIAYLASPSRMNVITGMPTTVQHSEYKPKCAVARMPRDFLSVQNGISFRRSQLSAGPMQLHAHRYFSSQSDSNGSDPTTGAPFEGTTDALPMTDIVSPADMTAIADAVNPAAVLGYWPSELVQKGIENVHLTLGLPYWETIALFTLFFRLALLPVTLRSLQNSGKLTAIRPQLQALTERYTKNAAVDMNDPNSKIKLQREILELYRHYKINPLSAFVLPFLQLPIFVSFFFGCRDMGQNFPGLTTGGAAWFTDLTAADPTYIFPVITSLSFLLMIEIGADGIPAQQKTLFKNVMRGLGVLMVPMTASMPISVFMYWTTNNLFSIAQTLAMKHPWVRKTLKIPDPPKPDPSQGGNPFQNITDMISKMKAGSDTAKTEIVEGRRVPPPPPELKTMQQQALPDDFRIRDKKHRK